MTPNIFKETLYLFLAVVTMFDDFKYVDSLRWVSSFTSPILLFPAYLYTKREKSGAATLIKVFNCS